MTEYNIEGIYPSYSNPITISGTYYFANGQFSDGELWIDRRDGDGYFVCLKIDSKKRHIFDDDKFQITRIEIPNVQSDKQIVMYIDAFVDFSFTPHTFEPYPKEYHKLPELHRKLEPYLTHKAPEARTQESNWDRYNSDILSEKMEIYHLGKANIISNILFDCNYFAVLGEAPLEVMCVIA